MNRARLAGVVLPLFAIRTRRDWGIGQISDLPACGAWIRTAGHTLLQVLPPYELADGETSPYGARTAFGLDPIYVDVEAIPDLDAADLQKALGADGRAALERLRRESRVAYGEVRALKTRALHLAFERFHSRDWKENSERAADFRAFVARESAWLDDLALYVALRDSHGGWGWQSWPEAQRDRSPEALASLRETHGLRILEYQYTQWIALQQWDVARAELRKLGVELMGDLPFVVCNESSDVWAHRDQFLSDRSLGAPPDAFSPDGQNWGLPPYNWQVMDRDELAWIRARTRHASRLYDRFRLDHIVGYFRMYVRKTAERGTFDPEGDQAQRVRGERVLRAILDSAGTSLVIGEDLGVIPPFVREALGYMHVPGYRVLPWERDSEHRLRDPHAFPKASVATWSTHDTAPITKWWEDLQAYERDDFARLARLPDGATYDERLHALLRLLLEASSDLTLVLAQELLGEKDRINTPGTVGGANWTYRLPCPLEDLGKDPEVMARMEAVRLLTVANGRFST